MKHYRDIRNYKSYLITCFYNILTGKELPLNMFRNKQIHTTKHFGREYSEAFLESLYDNIEMSESEEMEL